MNVCIDAMVYERIYQLRTSARGGGRNLQYPQQLRDTCWYSASTPRFHRLSH
jgi:hypothetical protein